MLHNALNTQVKTEASAMEKVGPAKTKDDRTEAKDLRSNPPTKVKLPSITKPSPPPVKDKPHKVPKTNGDLVPVSPKHQEEKDSDQFDGVDMSAEKLNHPTRNRAKPPQRRPPSALVTAAQGESDISQTEPELLPKKSHTEKLPSLQKGTENLIPSPAKPDQPPKTPPPPARPTPPRVVVDGRAVTQKEEPSLESLQAEITELRMALALLQTRQERDMQEMKEELQEERQKRATLQEEVLALRMKH